jgi:hypothetical protein
VKFSAGLACCIAQVVIKSMACFRQSFVNDGSCQLFTAATLARNAQRVAHLLEGTGSLVNRLTYLVVSDTFADAYIHKLMTSTWVLMFKAARLACFIDNSLKIMQMRMICNTGCVFFFLPAIPAIIRKADWKKQLCQ